MSDKRQTMARYEMIRLLMKKVGMPDYQAEYAVDSLFDAIAEWIKEGKEVMLPGLGRYIFIRRDAFRKSNLNLGSDIVPHSQVKFRMNQALARHVRVTTRDKK